MNETNNNIKRLAFSLLVGLNKDELNQLARMMNYEPDQLKQDIIDLYHAVIFID